MFSGIALFISGFCLNVKISISVSMRAHWSLLTLFKCMNKFFSEKLQVHFPS